MKNTIVACIILIFANTMANAEQIKRLSGDSKPRLTAAQVRELEQKESDKHPVEGYVSVKTVVDCFDEMSYQYSGGRYKDQEIKFRLRQPNIIMPGKKYPLVVWFHGRGESDDDNKRQLAHMQHTIEFLAGPKNLDFFILATQCPKDNRHWTTSISMEDGKGDAPIMILREIMEAVINEFPIDEDRISVFGLSSGGAGAWQFVMDSPERFSCIVACSTSVPTNFLPESLGIWAFACSKDKAIMIDQDRQTIWKINDKCGMALLTEIDSTAHDSWSEALNNKKVFAWMIRQSRLSFFNPPPGTILISHSWPKVIGYFGCPLICIAVLLLVRCRNSQ